MLFAGSAARRFSAAVLALFPPPTRSGTTIGASCLDVLLAGSAARRSCAAVPFVRTFVTPATHAGTTASASCLGVLLAGSTARRFSAPVPFVLALVLFAIRAGASVGASRLSVLLTGSAAHRPSGAFVLLLFVLAIRTGTSAGASRLSVLLAGSAAHRPCAAAAFRFALIAPLPLRSTRTTVFPACVGGVLRILRRRHPVSSTPAFACYLTLTLAVHARKSAARASRVFAMLVGGLTMILRRAAVPPGILVISVFRVPRGLSMVMRRALVVERCISVMRRQAT